MWRFVHADYDYANDDRFTGMVYLGNYVKLRETTWNYVKLRETT